ncbi:MAG TPA: hypothetical protein DDW52_28455 [Planctomycetaceae bacterium]|nr:hypothetical protein [Planctomycetaceae bacterium]
MLKINLRWIVLFLVACCWISPAHGQVAGLPAPSGKPAQVSTLLKRQISIDLRDATLLESLFMIRDLTGLNIVVGNEIQGTVNASFSSTSVDQILDTLLIPRGYSYRIVSGSVAVLPLDVIGDKLPNFETRVVTLEHSQVAELQPLVQGLLSPEGRAHAVASSNSLLIMDYADRVQTVTIQLNSLEQAAAKRAAMASMSTMGVVPDGRSNVGGQLGLAGAAQNDIRMQLASQISVDVFQPQYVPADELLTAVTPLLSQAGRISALPNENKLVFTDLGLNMTQIREALQKLDVPRAQVRIWALIYDAGLEDLSACGVNFSSGVNGSAVAASGSPAHQIMMDAVTAPVTGPTNGVLQFSTINRLGSMTSVIQALDTSDDSRLLADPNVVVMNHEEAQIQIVTEVPYQVLTQGIEGGTIGTTEFREAGVTLNVTPHISADSTIAMQVNPEFSLLTGFTEGDNAPIIDRRETQTTVRIGHLQTLVLGGLRQRSRIVEKAGIPGLRKLPYLGTLFRYNRSTARESELVVFITPEILTPDYIGTGRELCIAEKIAMEADLTPTDPIPFGMDVLMAEKKAEADAINTLPHKRHCNTPGGNCSSSMPMMQQPVGMIGGYDARH